MTTTNTILTPELEAEARRKWDTDASLRNDFTSFEAFAHFHAANAKGLVRILTGTVKGGRHA